MAKNVTVSWKLPTKRVKGGDLKPEDIRHVRVELSADGGAGFTELVLVLPTEEQKASVPELEAGDWHFRMTVVDTLGQKSEPVVHIETVLDESPPMPVTDITSTQT